MQLCIDIGNTRIKSAVFKDRESLHSAFFEKDVLLHVKEIFTQFPLISHSIISSVVPENNELEGFLRSRTKFIFFDHATYIPVKNNYQSPETLGKDRLAAAIGAWALFPNEDILVIDAGTALKVDLLTKQGVYEGGSISPGLQMRFKALNEFTGKLPFIKQDPNYKSLTGKNTPESILNGVQNGMLFELKGFIDAYKEQYPSIRVVITGGDAGFFELALKNHIFANPDLVSIGLNEIVLFNAEA